MSRCSTKFLRADERGGRRDDNLDCLWVRVQCTTAAVMMQESIGTSVSAQKTYHPCSSHLHHHSVYGVASNTIWSTSRGRTSSVGLSSSSTSIVLVFVHVRFRCDVADFGSIFQDRIPIGSLKTNSVRTSCFVSTTATREQASVRKRASNQDHESFCQLSSIRNLLSLHHLRFLRQMNKYSSLGRTGSHRQHPPRLDPRSFFQL